MMIQMYLTNWIIQSIMSWTMINKFNVWINRLKRTEYKQELMMRYTQRSKRLVKLLKIILSKNLKELEKMKIVMKMGFRDFQLYLKCKLSKWNNEIKNLLYIFFNPVKNKIKISNFKRSKSYFIFYFLIFYFFWPL